jgi:Leucine-rich repeat (LRR) protein
LRICDRLHSLPKEMGYMTSLIRLRVGNNALTELPVELERLTLLEDLSFDNNPIKNPREDVLAQGSESLIFYMQRMYESALTNGLEMIDAQLKHFPIETLTVPKLHSLRLGRYSEKSLYCDFAAQMY